MNVKQHLFMPAKLIKTIYTGGGKRATCMTITTAIVIWILAIICGIPALAGSNIKVGVNYRHNHVQLI